MTSDIFKGFDTTEDCSEQAQQIKQQGYAFVARYLSKSTWKVISSDEAWALGQAGLAIVLVYEDGPTTASYFSYSRGQSDGVRAATQASRLGAPDGTTLYFAVDYDASGDEITGPITDYFQGVAAGLAEAALSTGLTYSGGVYGSGATCQSLTDALLASKGWLAQATGWRGYSSYTSWAIKQGMPTTVCQLSVDPDVATGDYGAIPPSVQTS
jgi:hypothetical protein